MKKIQKIVLVTGANRGIGLEVCRQLADLNFLVYMGSRDLLKGEISHQKELQANPNIMPVALDVTNSESLKDVFRIIEKRENILDVLINNAGILYDDWQKILTADLDIIRQCHETNTLGPIQMVQTFLPLLRKSQSPRIVNVSSEAGAWNAMNGQTPGYSLSKIALNAATVMMAKQLKNENFLINAVCPGWTNTDMGKGGRPVKQGAKSVVWAATLPADGPSGGFFRDGKKLQF